MMSNNPSTMQSVQNSSGAASAKSGKFTLGVNTWVGYGPFWLAQDLGYYEAQGVDTKITVIEDSPDFAQPPKI